MEQRPRFAVRERVSLGVALVALVALVVGVVSIGLLVWPRDAGQRVAKNGGAGAAAAVVAPASSQKEVARFVEHFCPLTAGGVTNSTQVLGSPLRGMVRFQDPVHCFSIEYPAGWRMEDNAGSVYLWAPDTDGPRKNGSYWDADFFVSKPYQTADDEGAEYAQFIKKAGVRVRSAGVLVGSWEKGVSGDGFPTAEVFQERKIFSGRGEFTIHLQNDPKNLAKRALLEKIADSFTAQ